MDFEHILLITEIIGTIAFAFSGAMTAINKQMDIFGVMVLGGVTSVGGGCIRDVLLGITPPSMFVHPVYVIAATITSLVVFLWVKRYSGIFTSASSEKYLRLIDLLDAIGLGAFTVVGVDTAIVAGYGDNFLLLTFVGVITGVGGGILRDIMAGITPAVLRKRVYAVASLIGAIVYILIIPHIPDYVAMILGTFSVIFIRVLAAKYRWHLPKATLETLYK